MMRLLITLLAVLMLAVASCKEQTPPDTIVKEFLVAIDHFDYDNMSRLMVKGESTDRILTSMHARETALSAAEKEEYEQKEKNYVVDAPVISGEHATVSVHYAESEMPLNIVFSLHRQKGQWLVQGFSSR